MTFSFAFVEQKRKVMVFIKGGVDPVPDYFTLRRNPHPERYEDEIIAQAFHSNKK